MSLISIGYGSFHKMRESFEYRFEYLQRAYPLGPDTTEQELFRQWSEYRHGYELYQKRDEA